MCGGPRGARADRGFVARGGGSEFGSRSAIADGDAGMWGLADLFENFPAGARPYPDV